MRLITNSRKDMQFLHWVYILDGGNGFLTVHFSTDTDKLLKLVAAGEENILYARPFSTPLDALAHKYLLDALSLHSVRNIIRKHEKNTRMFCKLYLLELK